MLKKIGKGALSLFFLCVGAGVLTGFTYQILVTPSNPAVVEKTAETVYNTGLQPQAQQTQVQTAAAGNQPQEGDIFKQKGCIQCHSVSFYKVKGGTTGPDLDVAYKDAPQRFGKSLEKFLETPEGTMGDLLPKLTTTEDRKEILRLLSKAAGIEVQENSSEPNN